MAIVFPLDVQETQAVFLTGSIGSGSAFILPVEVDVESEDLAVDVEHENFEIEITTSELPDVEVELEDSIELPEVSVEADPDVIHIEVIVED